MNKLCLCYFCGSPTVWSRLINPRRACAARVTVVVPCVCLCVCVCVRHHYSATTGYKAQKERYQRLQCCVPMDIKKVIFLKVLRLKVMAWNRSEKANMLISLSSPRALIAHFRYQRSTETTRRSTGVQPCAPSYTFRHTYRAHVQIWITRCLRILYCTVML